MQYLSKVEKPAVILCILSYVMYLGFEVWRLVDGLKAMPLTSEEVESFRMFNDKLHSTASLFEILCLVIFLVYLISLIFKPLGNGFYWIKSIGLLVGALMISLLGCYLISASTLYAVMPQGDSYPFTNLLVPLIGMIPFGIVGIIVLSVKSIFKNRNQVVTE